MPRARLHLAAATVLVVLGACSTPRETAMGNAANVQRLQQLIAGKVAQAPIDCVPNYNANDMSVIDGRTLAFRVAARTTYVAQLSEGCSLLASGRYALLTKSYGGSGLCRGDIAQVFDASSRMVVGSCAIGEITPYARP